MLNRIEGLYRRFVSAKLRITLPGRPLHDSSGALAGYVERVELAGGSLRVSGWVIADRLSLVFAGQEVSTVPSAYREDVRAATGLPAACGFDVSMPCHVDMVRHSASPGLIFVRRDGVALPDCSLPRPRLSAARAIVLRASFAIALLGAVPALIRWRRRQDQLARDDIKRALGLGAPATLAMRLDADRILDRADIPRAPKDRRVDIVLPIYNAFDLLPEVLDRVERHTDLPYRLIMVEDASSDVRVKPFLRDWAAGRDRVTLLENSENLGFIGTVNRAFAHVMEGNDDPGAIVLLNSDAFVPAGWASRLISPLEDEPDVASVTPMSNDAEIFTVPVVCKPVSLASGAVDLIDAEAQRTAASFAAVTAPTGVGFCMAIAPDWLRQVGAFDIVFGRGYGEEVDWCQKIRAKGGRHVAIPWLFVEHRGGGSFGSDAKMSLVARNNEIIARRYPAYDREVQDFIAHDPLLTPRLLLAVAAVGADADQGHVAVYIAHSLGGGAEHYLARRIDGDRAAGRGSVVLRLGGPERFQIEVVTAAGATVGMVSDLQAVAEILSALPRRRLIYSCAVGDPDPVEIPDLMLRLGGETGHAIEILFHDFFPITPGYTLLNAKGHFRGVPDPTSVDAADTFTRRDNSTVTLKDWRAAWGNVAAASDQLTVFSNDSARHVAAAFPVARDRIVVTPHHPAYLPEPISAPDGPTVIAALGNINRHKGAAVLESLARAIGTRRGADRPGLVLMGNLDPNFELPSWVPVTGSYSIQTLSALARSHGVTHWLIPSVWPETFSFTTHEALATGLPVLAFDIGAQGDAVALAENGHSVPLGTGDPDEAATAILRAVLREGIADPV